MTRLAHGQRLTLMWWPLVPRVPALIKIRRFTVLAVESSADDTCAAVVASSGEILSNVVVKQNDVWVPIINHLLLLSPLLLSRHEPFGGIHPYWAVQAHQQNLVGWFPFPLPSSEAQRM
jgi:N6-L-threonylcarbamoyladenine synthase